MCAKASLLSVGAPRHVPALRAWGETPGCSALRTACAFGGLSANQRRRSKVLPSCAVDKSPSYLRRGLINIEALCAAPPEAFARSPSQMPLSCPVALPSQRELNKDRAAAEVFSKTMALRRSIARFPQGNQKNTAHETNTASGIFDEGSMTTATGTVQNDAKMAMNGKRRNTRASGITQRSQWRWAACSTPSSRVPFSFADTQLLEVIPRRSFSLSLWRPRDHSLWRTIILSPQTRSLAMAATAAGHHGRLRAPLRHR